MAYGVNGSVGVARPAADGGYREGRQRRRLRSSPAELTTAVLLGLALNAALGWRRGTRAVASGHRRLGAVLDDQTARAHARATHLAVRRALQLVADKGSLGARQLPGAVGQKPPQRA